MPGAGSIYVNVQKCTIMYSASFKLYGSHNIKGVYMCTCILCHDVILVIVVYMRFPSTMYIINSIILMYAYIHVHVYPHNILLGISSQATELPLWVECQATGSHPVQGSSALSP